jgi:hypothetical protein
MFLADLVVGRMAFMLSGFFDMPRTQRSFHADEFVFVSAKGPHNIYCWVDCCMGENYTSRVRGVSKFVGNVLSEPSTWVRLELLETLTCRTSELYNVFLGKRNTKFTILCQKTQTNIISRLLLIMSPRGRKGTTSCSLV